MSFVPAPQQANAASANKNNATTVNSTNNLSAAAAAAATDPSDGDHMFKMRTFDVFWVEKSALMYRDGIAKVRTYVQIYHNLSLPLVY